MNHATTTPASPTPAPEGVDLRALVAAAEAGYEALRAIRDDVLTSNSVSGRNQTLGQEAIERISNVLHPDAWDRSKDLIARLDPQADKVEALRVAARNDALEEAAQIAEAHKGSAKAERLAKKRHPRTEWDINAVRNEERGEDIASSVIAKAIRDLRTALDAPRDGGA